MTGFILGEKLVQSQHFTKEGLRIPTTFIRTSPCYLIDIKEPKTNGYTSIKLGFGQIKNIKQPQSGELKKAGIKAPLHFFREFRLEKYNDQIKIENKEITIDSSKIKIGDEVKPTNFFKIGDMVTVSGTSKGKGFQGVVKRHAFKGGPRTHGQSHGERAPGSIGSTTTPGRINKGKRMAGRMGGETITIKNLKIIDVKDDGILVKGLVPGGKSGLLEIVSSI